MVHTLRKVLEVLTPQERWLLWLVFAGVLASALLETAGVASIGGRWYDSRYLTNRRIVRIQRRGDKSR